MPAGRPSERDRVDLKLAERASKAGLSDAQLAEVLGIGLRTLYTYRLEWPEFQQATKDWKSEADGRVERSLYERACGYSATEEKIHVTKDGEVVTVPTIKHYPPDTAALCFWLKNRQPKKWRDKVEHEHDGELKVTIDIPNAKKEDSD